VDSKGGELDICSEEDEKSGARLEASGNFE